MRDKQEGSVLIWVLVAGLLAQNLAIPVMSRSFENQKNYYSPPDPHSGTPPSSHGSPPHGSTPRHGSGSHGSGCSSGGTTPPSHGGCNPTPASPPPSSSNCGTPPSVPTPSRPSYNPPSGGGGSYYPPPTSSGGSPPTPVIISPPTTPSIVPGPPFIPDPNTPIGGTCNYWSTHPTVVWGLLGWWCTLGSAFGVPSVGPGMNVLQALSNSRTDGLGALYREGTASLLNSMVNSRFPFNTKQVRDNFVTALGSNKAAGAQARVFKLANEGHLKPRN